VLIAFFLALFIGKSSIVDRIIKLQTAAEQIAAGDLNVRVAHLLEGGELGRLAKTFDVMAQKLADDIKERLEAVEEYRTIIRTTSDGFCVCDAKGRILDANAAYCSIVGFTREELLTMSLTDLEANEKPEMIGTHIRNIINLGSDSFTSVHKRKDGSTVDVEVTVTYLNEHGGRFYSFVRDIADRKKLEAELLRAATYDRLTGVLNRQALEDRILNEIERARRYGKPFSLIMLDIDDFKHINDTLGHQSGDKVLSGIARILGQHSRIVDSVGRWGGEEFVILLAESRGKEAALVAEKLRSALTCHSIDEVASVTASFGVAEFQKGDSLDSMIKRVDDLLYLAKNRGKNQVETAAI
jgi:diguanylate cyclase (GGDEF)-like protein/PAS domain S-box-containing protein